MTNNAVANATSMHVHIVDDEPSIRRSMAALLQSHGYKTSTYDSADAFLEVDVEPSTSCLVLDLRMPGMSGLELQKTCNQSMPKLPVIILTGHGDVAAAVAAMKAGAVDFLEKPAAETEILTAIGEAHKILADRSSSIVDETLQARLDSLTPRERDVLDHLILGRTNKEIAIELGISQRTVEVHRGRVKDKMKARSLSELIRMML